tara:strand:- start:2900 stop:3184 length:285 start_codon:yes stop_codon:yes gene_type:complete
MGISSGIGKVFFYGGLIVAGYAMHGCVNNDKRYDVRRYDGTPYLIDKRLDERLVITSDGEKMQLGDLEYRVESVLEDDKLREHLNKLKRKMEVD